MSDLEPRLRAARGALPAPPAVPEACRAAVRRAVAADGVASAPRARRPRRGRRIGGALALAAVLAAAGLAAAGVRPFDVAPGAEEGIDATQRVVLGDVRHGTQQVILSPGRAGAGELCVTLANAQGPADVSPLVCQPASRADAPGFDYNERPPGAPGWGFHVRLPDPADLRGAIVSEYAIPVRGGTVTFASGVRTVRRSFPDTTALDARADRDARAHAQAGLARVRREIGRPEARVALARLPEAERTALQLRVFDELDYTDIAARMGSSVATSRTRVSRALKTLGVEMNGMLP